MEDLNKEIEKINQESILENNFKKNQQLMRKYLVLFVFIIAVLASYFVGLNKGKSLEKPTDSAESIPITQSVIENQKPTDKNVDFSLFWKVWDLLKEKHIDRNSLDTQKLVYGAINGMLQATGDPYTSFFNPEDSKKFNEDIEGSFEGIGAELGIKDKILTVIAPLEGSPAEKAGLRPGDKILKIGDKVAADLTIDEAVDLIRGEKNTQVTLTVLSIGQEETREVTITRGVIEVKSVKLEFKDDSIAYVKINRFGDTTDTEFNQAASEIISKNSKGIILDLRSNPGGLLDKSVEVASRMISKGEVVVTEEDAFGKKDSYKTSGGDKLSSIPTVILVNEGSASASEILAGALKDDRGLILIGKKTFGKGSVQQLISLKGGSSVKITVAKWLTPAGEYIMEKGISPDIDVDLTLDDFKNDRDPQLDKALEVIKEKMNQK